MNPSEKMQTEASPSNAVLLVDEDPRYLESIRNLIQRSGYSVHACNSYPEGIRQLKSGAFDIVVVGQGSRKFEGRSVLEVATAVDRRLPVIVVARFVEMGCYLEAMQLGAVDYISPGPLGSEIGRTIETHMRVRKSHPGAAKRESLTLNAAGLVA
jgi:two-component system C4-dicarboxylate transport response regulator DctD